MSNIMKKMHSPRNFQAPAEFLNQQSCSQMKTVSKKKLSLCSSILEDPLGGKSFHAKSQKQKTNVSIEDYSWLIKYSRLRLELSSSRRSSVELQDFLTLGLKLWWHVRANRKVKIGQTWVTLEFGVAQKCASFAFWLFHWFSPAVDRQCSGQVEIWNHWRHLCFLEFKFAWFAPNFWNGAERNRVVLRFNLLLELFYLLTPVEACCALNFVLFGFLAI